MVVETQLRADAQRNLERILEAARAVFAEHGLDASVSDVAERAGVGTATIFRRFPTKDDLCVAVVESEMRGMLAFVEDAPGLAELMTSTLERFVVDRCLCDAAGGALFERPRIVALRNEIKTAVEALLRRDQQAGKIRADLTADDVSFFVSAIGLAGSQLEKTSPGTWRRYVELLLDGLRA